METVDNNVAYGKLVVEANGQSSATISNESGEVDNYNLDIQELNEKSVDITVKNEVIA